MHQNASMHQNAPAFIPPAVVPAAPTRIEYTPR